MLGSCPDHNCVYSHQIQIILPHHQPPRLTSPQITSPHNQPYHITSQPTTSHHITSHHITSHHITSHHITSHHITSHHITSHHITSHHTTPHHTTPHHATTNTPPPKHHCQTEQLQASAQRKLGLGSGLVALPTFYTKIGFIPLKLPRPARPRTTDKTQTPSEQLAFLEVDATSKCRGS